MFSHLEKLTNLTPQRLLSMTLVALALLPVTAPAQGKEVVIYNQNNTSARSPVQRG